MQSQKARDSKMAELMAEVREFLPSLQREIGVQTSDYLVHPSALAHLRRRFNWIGSTLLRNDSLTDMSERSILYFELFSWLEVRIAIRLYVYVDTDIIVSDHFEPRGAGFYDGHAHHGCRLN